jgi:hypothetical protein
LAAEGGSLFRALFHDDGIQRLPDDGSDGITQRAGIYGSGLRRMPCGAEILLCRAAARSGRPRRDHTPPRIRRDRRQRGWHRGTSQHQHSAERRCAVCTVSDAVRRGGLTRSWS